MGWGPALFPSPTTVNADGRAHVVNLRCQAQRAVTRTRICGPEGLWNRSYTLPERWPFLPFHLVMEEHAGACDLYLHTQVCCAMASELIDIFVEAQVRQVIASFLHGCDRRPCRSVDLGANNGWMTSYMLALGSHVISVEPAADLAAAIRATATLNCWSDRSVVVDRFACAANNGDHRYCPGPNGWPGAFGHRAGGTPQGLGARLPRSGKVVLRELLLGEGRAARDFPALPRANGAPPHFDLLKLDGDGPEELWLHEIARLITSLQISVGTITFEATGHVVADRRCPGWCDVFANFQRMGFAVLRLDFQDERRFVDSRGWDLYSPNGTFARIDRHGALPRDALEQELLGVRAMRHVWQVHPNLTRSEWTTLLQQSKHVRPRSVMQFVLTREAPLLYPAFGSRRERSLHWRASRPALRGDGFD